MASASSEDEFIEELRKLLGPPSERITRWIGDDCAVVTTRGASATSIDVAVEGTHFPRLAHPDCYAIGFRSMAAALSDLAAMGADPGEAYVGVTTRSGLTQADLLELHRGLGEAAMRSGVSIAGGDLTSSEVLSIAITVVGYAISTQDFRGRDGASEGERVGVTGSLGASGAGLYSILHPARETDALRESFYRRPLHLSTGVSLRPHVSAMIDLSDGLLADLPRLAKASHVQIAVELENLPISSEAQLLAKTAGVDPLKLALVSGEDFELCFTTANPETIERTGVPVSWIGEVRRGTGVDWGRTIPADWRSWDVVDRAL